MKNLFVKAFFIVQCDHKCAIKRLDFVSKINCAEETETFMTAYDTFLHLKWHCSRSMVGKAAVRCSSTRTKATRTSAFFLY